MCKGTVLSILTLLTLAGEEVTELSLVLIFVIKSLHSVMSSSAFVLLRALLSVSELAKFRRIEVVISTLVLYGVGVVTTLVVVSCVFIRTI